MKPSLQAQPVCPLLPPVPSECWHGHRGGDTSLSSPCCLPYYFRSPKFLPRPSCLSQGPPGCRTAKPSSSSRCSLPPPSPRHGGTPSPGGVCVVPSTRSSWLDDPRLAHPVGDVQSLVPQHPVGLLMLSRPGDSPTSAPKTGSARSAPAARGDLGIIPPDLFPGGWGGVAARLSSGNA